MGFSRDAAEKVAGASLSQLSALVEKSLLRRTTAGRYELHELLRQYAVSRLDERPGEHNTIRAKHCGVFTDLLTDLSRDLRGPHQTAALAELELEIDNLRAAWATAVDDGYSGAIANAAYGLWLFSEITGRNREVQQLLQRGVDLLDAAPEGDDASESESQHRLPLGRLLTLLGSVSVRTGEHGHGDALVERGLAILQTCGQPEDLALGLNFRAAFAHARLDYDQEESFLRESLHQAVRAADHWTMPYSLNDLGMVLLARGDLIEADRLCRESLATFHDIDDKRGIAFALHNLGVVAIASDQHDEAEELLREALMIRRELSHTWGMAVTLVELGVVARESGDREIAVERFRDALRTASEAHALPAILRALTEVGGLLTREGDWARAIELLTDVLCHTGVDPIVRARAEHVLSATNEIRAAQSRPFHGKSDTAIDRHVHDLLQHGLPWPAVLA